jgi:hypothetical protein
MKSRIIDRYIRLSLINNNLLFVGVSLPSGLDRRRNKHAAGFFVISEIGLNLFLRAVLDALCHDSNL